MPDTRVHVVKNVGRIGSYDTETGMPTGLVDDYITTSQGKGVSRRTPVGFSKEVADQMAERLGFDPAEAVIVAPDDMVVALHDSARKLPQNEPVILAQFKANPVTM